MKKQIPYFILAFAIIAGGLFLYGGSIAFGAALQNYNLGASGATNYEVGEAVWTGNVFQLQTRAGGTGVLRAVQMTVGTNSGIYINTSGNTSIATTTFPYSSSDNAGVTGNPSTNVVSVAGSVQLIGNSDAIVFGRGTSSFLKDEELAFGWGGGWHMTDGTYLRVRGNKTLYSTGGAEFGQPVVVGTPTATNHATTKSYVDSVVGGGAGSGSFATLSVAGTSTLATTAGNVGIGTTGPKTILHTGKFSGGSGGIDEIMRVTGDYTALGSGALLRFTNQHNSGINPNTGEYNLGGIAGVDDTNNWGASLVFYTAPSTVGGGNLTERMRIKSDGNVGIGTTSPSVLFEVDRGTSSGSVAEFSGGGNGGIRIQINNNTDSLGTGEPYRHRIGSQGGSESLAFFANNADRMVISSAGNIGISSATPAYKLDVAGTGQFTQPVIVGTPTAAGHATTKSYVDSMFTGSGQWTTSGTNIYYSLAGNVGIGTTSPASKLDVGGDIAQNGSIISTIGTWTAVSTTTDWYTVGYISSGRGYGEFFVENTQSSQHQALKFIASIQYGGGAQISVLENSIFATVPFSKIRIARLSTDVTYGAYAVQVYGADLYGTGNTNRVRIANLGNQGWTLKNFTTAENGSYVATAAEVSISNQTVTQSGNSVVYGNVGIGSVTPAYKLDVTGTGQFTQPVLVGTPTAAGHATTKSYVDSATVGQTGWTDGGGSVYLTTIGDRVGIGSASPAAKLEVYENSTNELLRVKNTSAGTQKLLNIENYSTSTGALLIRAYSSTGGGEVFSVTPAGNVGIGTASPGARLDVRGSDYLTGHLYVGDGTFSNPGNWDQTINLESNQHARILIEETSTGVQTALWSHTGGNAKVGTVSSHNFGIMTAGSEKATITTGGNFGIGSTSPAYKLDVAGTGQFTQPVIVGTPTATNHATTKSYVDSAVSTVGGRSTYSLSGGPGWYRIISMGGAGVGGKVRISGLSGSNRYTDLTFYVSGMGYSQGSAINVVNNVYYNTNHVSNIRAGTDGTSFVVDVELNGIDTPTNITIDLEGGLSGTTPVFNPTAPTGGVVTVPGDIVGGGSSARNTYLGIGTKNVGIGTASPSRRLSVQETVGVNDSGGVERFVVSATSGGIDLHIKDSAGTSAVRFDSRAGGLSYINTGNVGIGTTSPANDLTIQQVATTGGETVAAVKWQSPSYALGYLGADTGNYNSGAIYIYKDGAANTRISGNNTSYLMGGNVGIGSGSPAYKLDVAGTGQFTQPVLVGTPTAAGHATTKSYVDSATVGQTGWTDGGTNVYLTTATDNVGIGTTTPDSKFQVQGTVKIQNVVSSSPDSNFRRMINVASYEGGGTSRIGILVIKLPTPLAHSMANIKISGWSYTKAWDLTVSGYMHPDSGWIQVGGSVLTGNPPFTLSEIRLAADVTTDTFYILLGSASTAYGYYASVGVDVDSIYSNALASTGWDIYIAASDPTISTSLVPTVSLYGSQGALISGNVGIGSTSPAYKLDVAGTGQFTQPVIVGTPTAAGHATTKSYVDSMFTGSGQWTTSGTNIYYSLAGNVGIGTTSPGAKLEVQWVGAYNPTPTSNPIIQWARPGGAVLGALGYDETNTKLYLGSVTSHKLSLRTGDLDRVTIDTSGNIGIGTTSPTELLTLNKTSGKTGIRLEGNGTDVAEFYLSNAGTNHDTYFGTVANNPLYLQTAGSVRMTIASNAYSGNIGINSTTPGYKLDVVGTGSFTQPVIVGTPTASSHATTKSYVDSALSGGAIPIKKATSAAVNFSTQSVIVADLGGYDDARRHAGIIKISVSNGPSGNSLGSAMYEILPEFNQGLQTGWILRALDATYFSAKKQLGHILKLYSAAYTNSEPIYLVYEGNTLVPNENSYYVTVEWFGIQSDKNLMMEVINKTTDARVTGAGAARVVTAIDRYDDRYGTAAIGWTKSGSYIYATNVGDSVGIGTTTPGTKLDVAGSVSAVMYYDRDNTNYYIDPAKNLMPYAMILNGAIGVKNTSPTYDVDVTGTLRATGNWSLGGAAQTNLNMNNLQILGVSKIDVGTIDPLYEIEGGKYATYASSIAGGVKEEYVGRGKLTASISNQCNENSMKIANCKLQNFEYVIDFSKVERGSDLWVWRKTVDFSKDNVEVMATAYGIPVPVAYTIKNNSIVFSAISNFQFPISNEGIEFSFRLVGKRFDWKNWPTFGTDQTKRANLIVK